MHDRSFPRRFAASLVLMLSASFFSPVLFAAPSTPTPTPTPAIVGYVFPQGAVLKPTDIDATRLTRINYAFANIAHGRIVPGFPTDAANFATLTALRDQHPALAILISVGGWTWSGAFSDMALTHTRRAVFIESVADLLTRYSLDGLDIDWEYPGQPGAGHRFRPQDKQNYTLLLAELRHRLTLLRQQNHHPRPYLLTIAAGASDDFLEHTQMAQVAHLVDTVNLMAYDYYEPTDDRTTGHHAPLFTNPLDPKQVSADASVRAFEQAGVPASRILLGLPFYGHIWSHVPDRNHGLFQPGSSIPDAYAPYGVIASTMLDHGFTRYWDPTASAPYLYNADKQLFVSYDDPESLTLKCTYVLRHRLGGVMFWDYSSDPTGTLLRTLDTALHPPTNPSH
ncbi:MAG TPA: glycoside hydrolase family 18 protein [Granulicella sp.]|nr:glycoside hydrolase family 18 protein [Granulicella sp.]